MNAAYNVLDFDEFNRNNFDRREETRSRRSQASANQIEINLQPYIIPLDQLEVGIVITQAAVMTQLLLRKFNLLVNYRSKANATTRKGLKMYFLKTTERPSKPN